jgi:hypothetical protein
VFAIMGPSKTKIDIKAAREKAIESTKRLHVAATIREKMGPTKFGSLYGPKLDEVVKPSPVADAVNPTPSMPHDEVQSSLVGRTSVYKGVLFNVKEGPEQQEEPQSQGLGPSSSGG